MAQSRGKGQTNICARVDDATLRLIEKDIAAYNRENRRKPGFVKLTRGAWMRKLIDVRLRTAGLR